ncbi:MAG: hypothetical protein JF589_10080 [Gemmatimonadetes bacterium]|nr:hypothetical protein [Gemmatimonadota bacterium]
MPRRPFVVIATLVGLIAATGSIASAQRSPSSGPNTLEFGIDAGATFGFGDQSSVQITLPASRFRVGFFLPNSRWSIEPATFLSWTKVEGADGVFVYDLEVGALYHLAPPSDITAPTPVSVVYVRPFIGVQGASSGGKDDSEFFMGAGLGVELPARQNIAWRLEANTGYGFDNKAFRLGLLAGLSFFTK